MSRSLRLYFEDILNSCHKVLRYTKGISYDQFFEDELRFDAAPRIQSASKLLGLLIVFVPILLKAEVDIMTKIIADL